MNCKMKKKITVFIGVIGSGKDHNTKKFIKENPGVIQHSFSDGVREFTWNIIGWAPKDEQEYEYFKDNPVLNISSQDWISVKSMKGRNLLENVADQMRRYDIEFWGKYWLEKAKRILATNDQLVVSDCRHHEEASKIFNLCTHLGIDYEFRFCNYKSERYEIRDHSSEFLAQQLIEMGCEDGEIINEQVLKTILR